MNSLKRLAFVLALAAAPLWAGPVSSPNVVVLDDAPASLRNGHLESNLNAFLFRESGFTASSGVFRGHGQLRRGSLGQ